MERSEAQLGNAIRESVARFVESAAGREVMISISARLVKRNRNNVLTKKPAEEPKLKTANSSATSSNQSTLASSDQPQANSCDESCIDWYGQGVNRHIYSNE